MSFVPAHLRPEQVALETREVSDWLVRAVGPSPQLRQAAPSPQLTAAVHALLRREDVQERGDFMSTVMRLPAVWGNALQEYIQGESHYGQGPGLVCTLRHCGGPKSKTVRVQVSEQRIPKVSPSTGVVSDNYETQKIYRNVEPGEEIELNARWAVHALWSDGRYAMSSALWPRMSADEFRGRNLVETAYRAEWAELEQSDPFASASERGQARIVTVDSRKWQAKKVADAVARAKDASGKDAAKAELELIRPWWPVSEELAKMRLKYEKTAA